MRDEKLRRIARRQHGLFSLEQAVEAGYSRPTVWRRVARGVWEAVEPRVYRPAATAPLTWLQSTMALTMATRGYASGRSAAAVHGLLEPPARPSVTVRRSLRSSVHAGDPRVKSTEILDADDLVVVRSIPVFSVARTLIDVLGLLPRPLGEDVLDRALSRRMISGSELRERAEAAWAPRRRGCAIVLRLLDERSDAVVRVRNDWEARVLRACRRRGLPEPIPNFEVVVGGGRRFLDFAWPEAMVALEFDGFDPHSTRRVFDDDRVRQNGLVAMGWRVFRLTSTALRQGAGRALDPVAVALQPDNR